MRSLAIPSRRLALSLPTWPASLLPVFIGIAGFITMLGPARDPDLNWHLRSGELILTLHAIPRADPYSFTMKGAPWVEQEWLWQVTAALLHRLAGATALIVANALLLSAALVLVYATGRLRRASASFSALGAIFSLATINVFGGIRPAAVVIIFAASFILILERYNQTRDRRLLLVLVPMETLWANCHGSYIIGPFLCGIFGASDWLQRRNWRCALLWTSACACVFAAVLLNPIGARLLQFSLAASRLPFNRLFIGEWKPPNFQDATNLPLMGLLVLSMAIPLLLKTARPTLQEALLLVSVTIAVLQSQQFVSLYAVACAPIVAQLFERGLSRTAPARFSFGSGIALLASLVALAAIFPFRTLTSDVYQQTMRADYPVDAVAFIQRHHLVGPMFNQLDWGGYLIGALPNTPVFVDGRTEMYGEDFLERYFKVVSGLESPYPTLDAYGINLVLVRRTDPIATELRTNFDWNEVFDDKISAVFVPRGSPLAAANAEGPEKQAAPGGLRVGLKLQR